MAMMAEPTPSKVNRRRKYSDETFDDPTFNAKIEQ